jgi:N-acetylglucosaminyl-diphospho-decaprenol L-rhamnosyltransferase
MDISVLIVNWNSRDFLRRCLLSLDSNITNEAFEVIVVDNASYDGCAEMLRSEFPAVRFIQSTENIGFARGNNLAAAHATGDYLLLLNSDTEVIGTAVQDLLACVETRADAGVVGAKLLNTDLSIQTSCVQAFPSIINQLLDTRSLYTIFPRWALWGNHVLVDGSTVAAVEGISGACMMLRRTVFERLGGFSTRYFMYGEDMDLCYRAKQIGLTNYYLGMATIVHHGGQSTSTKSDKQFSAVMMKESTLKFLRAHRGGAYALAFKCATAAAALCRLGLIGVAMLLPLADDRRRGLSLALAKWSRILRWAIGLESWAKQAA